MQEPRNGSLVTVTRQGKSTKIAADLILKPQKTPTLQKLLPWLFRWGR